MSEPKSERVWVNVTPAIRAELDAEAERLDVPLSHIIREAIRAYLKAMATA